MRVGDKEFRTVWMEHDLVKMIHQPLLPHQFRIYVSKNYQETANAIKNMVVRGAPAIGATGAFGMAQAALQFRGTDKAKFDAYMENVYQTLASTRPTAYELFHAMGIVRKKIRNAPLVKEAQQTAVQKAQEYANESVENCRKIGEFGERLIRKNSNILTHCNAGALACVDYGTALAPIRIAHQNNKNIHVWVDETRPRNQGSKLTAWELQNERIPHHIIADNAAGLFMQKKEVDIVIVGADRIATNGDTANKIGTYEKAVLAKENRIPFYVAAPLATVDFNCKSGSDIPIEERNAMEVQHMSGWNEGKWTRVRIAPEESPARNPAFDVTPARYITGIITEKGVLKPSQLKKWNRFK